MAVLFVLAKVEQKSATAENSHGVTDFTAANDEIALQVEAAPADIGDLVMRLSVTGLTKALQEIIVSSKVSAEILQLPIEEGQLLRKGALMMKLDEREYRLAVAEARDKLLGTQVEYGLLLRDERGARSEERELENENRGSKIEDGGSKIENRKSTSANHSKTDESFPGFLKDKFQNGDISEEEYLRKKLDFATEQVLAGKRRDELMRHKSGLTAAALALQRTELNLSYTEIRASFSGLVADLEVEVGQQITAGQECFKLVDLSQIKVELQVLESEIGLVQKGRWAEVTFPAFPGESFQGKVMYINPIVDLETRTARVIVRFENPGRQLLPGMFAYAKLEAQIFRERFLVPKDAVLIRDQRKLLFIVRDGLAKWCYVETGLENEEFVEILSSTFGLMPGEMVITSGHYTLVHDAKVRF